MQQHLCCWYLRDFSPHERGCEFSGLPKNASRLASSSAENNNNNNNKEEEEVLFVYFKALLVAFYMRARFLLCLPLRVTSGLPCSKISRAFLLTQVPVAVFSDNWRSPTWNL